jgi:ribosomal protein L18E
MPLFARSFLKWLPIGVAVTLVLGIAYAFVQQSYRQDANDPQIMMARDVAAGLAAGKSADSLVSSEQVDPSKDLAPFVIVLAPDRTVVVSSAVLGASAPVPPGGVLTAAKASGENRVTWQPRADTRIAAVVVPVNTGPGGWVIAGRSLQLAEERESALTQMAGLGLLGTLVATFIAAMFAGLVEDRIGARG